MTRPFINYSIDQLEEEYDRASASADRTGLRKLLHELSFRKTSRAKDLRREIEQDLAAPNAGSPSGNTQTKAAPKASKSTGSKASHQGPTSSRSKHKPTPEQTEAVDAFLKGGSLKINAYAGTGKTSTLEMLAHATTSRGQYIAFNRDIVRDAKQKFPSSVNCSTVHGLAFRATPSPYKDVTDKMTGKVNAHKLAELLTLTKNWRIDRDYTLKPLSQGSLILKTVQRFTQSADLEPIATHVPRHGSLLAAPEPVIKAVEDFAVRGARYVWGRMQEPSDPMPLGHDGYLKLWALSNPLIAADFILLDEAQDTNPVVLDVLRKQPAQMVYVGDRYQQIYEWRGAVNAMEKIETDATTRLTKSFRFGEAIAEAATKVLGLLGERIPIVGNPSINSRIAVTQPRTIIARTNATTITAVIEALDASQKPYLVGGNAELMDLLKGVQDLKRGEPSTVADFFGFQNWNEVVAFSRGGEGEHLLTFVNLVEARGEKQLMWALNRTEDDEDDSDIIISTAHKAKGREWPKVRLMDDFLKSRPRRQNEPNEAINGHDPAELRLFYVALTRAGEEMEVAPNVLPLIGLNAGIYADAPQSKPRRQRPSQQQSSDAKPSRPSAQHTEWAPPKNWEPAPKAPRCAPAQREPSPSPKKKGLFGWLFGN